MSSMNEIKEMVELLGEQKMLQQQLQEVQSKLNPIKTKIGLLNERISFSTELNDFLCKKILEAFTEDELNELYKYRKLTHPNPFIKTEKVYVNSKVFDPNDDSWYIYDYEQDGDNIRFLVSCRKNEGSISGLMTFLDTHYTNWFNINKLP